MTLGTGLAIGMWMYCGYESMSSVAGELENPQVIPKALILVVPIMAASYILPTVAGIASIGHWEEWSTDGEYSYAAVLGQNLGPAFGIAFAVIAVIANLSIYNTYIASGSRGFFVLAEDRLAPPLFAKVNENRGIPHVAIISMAVFNAVFCIFPFSVVVVIGMFIYMFSLGMILVSGVRFRKLLPERPEGIYKIPVKDKTLVAIAVLPCVIMALALYTAGTDYFIFGVVTILSGPFMYVLWKRKYGGLTKIDKEKYPVNPKTKLGVKDLWHLSNFLLVTAAATIFAKFFLAWYEAGWEKADYDMFDPEYDLPDGLSAIYDAISIEGMQNGILIFGLVSLLVGVVLRIVDKKMGDEIL